MVIITVYPGEPVEATPIRREGRSYQRELVFRDAAGLPVMRLGVCGLTRESVTLPGEPLEAEPSVTCHRCGGDLGGADDTAVVSAAGLAHPACHSARVLP